MATMVKTDAMCFFGGRRYRPGDVFELPEGASMASYLTVVGKAEAKAVKPKAKVASKEPSTFSELTAQEVNASRPKGVSDEDAGRISDLV